MIYWNKIEIYKTKNLNKVISTLYYLEKTSKLITSMAQTYSCPNLSNYYRVYQVHEASSSWK